MSTLLLDFAIGEQCAVIQFLWSEGVKPSEVHRIMLAQHRENCITQRKVYQWVAMFLSGTPSIVDDECSDRPSTS